MEGSLRPSILSLPPSLKFPALHIFIIMAALMLPVVPLPRTALDYESSTSHYGNLLLRCAQLNSLPEGKAVHARITKLGIELRTFLGNCLVNMYSKCGSIKDARSIFDIMPQKNLVSWNVMVAGYAQQGLGHEALHLFQQMKCEAPDTFIPNAFTFGSVLKACATSAALEEGKQVHCHVVKLGLEDDVFLGSALVDMYSKCGSIDDAGWTFATLSRRNVVSWNAMLAAYVRCGRVKETFKLFSQMLGAGVEPSHVTFGFVLKACASVEQGKQIHAQVLKSRLGSHLFVGSAVILMYMKCGCAGDGRQVFDKMPIPDLALFNAAIQGYADSGMPKEAVKLFCELLRAAMKPNDITLSTVLKTPEDLDQAKQLHGYIIKTVFRSNVSVVTMYARCGAIDDARQVFDKMPHLDVVLYTSMIAGYAQKGYAEEALKLFVQMQCQGVRPNRFTFPTVLSACASLTFADVGKQIHTHILKIGAVGDAFVGSGLVDMYVKCGNIENARQTFDRMPKQDIVLWNVMITGYVQHGYPEAALQAFEELQQFGLKPNHNTFVAVLFACSQLGLVGLGRRYFDSLSRVHGIIPGMEHYACMVDILGRAGRLYEARDFIKNMPFEPGPLVWDALLQACKSNGVDSYKTA